jgi:Peptidase_G2, IMC autoproteolytic cleavage domain
MHKIEQPKRRQPFILVAVLITVTLMILLGQPGMAMAQWATNGTNINNTNTGNVGIGTTTPTAKLEVNGTTAVSGNLVKFAGTDPNGNVLAEIVSTGTAGALLSLTGGGGTPFLFQSGGTNSGIGNNRLSIGTWSNFGLFTIQSNGNVGIGTTSPLTFFHAKSPATTHGNMYLDTTSAGYSTAFSFLEGGVGRASIQHNASVLPGGLVFQTGGIAAPASTRMVITSTGNVGIGTNSPSVRLDVAGQVRSGSGGFVFPDGTVQTTAATGTGPGPWSNNGSNIIYYNGGSVGIGTSNPTKTLDVAGTINASGTITGGNIVAKYQDVAEWVPAAHHVPAGTVVVLNPNKSNQVLASTKAYDTRVAGVISAQPGLILGESGEGKVMVATTGRVKVKVDARRAPIHIGDLLVTSAREGLAMKSQPLSLGGAQIHRPGTLIGKALEPMESGTGEILVLLSLQ